MSTKVTFGCEFGGVSIGDQTARIGVAVDKAGLDPLTAEEVLCGRRVSVKIELQPENEKDQRRFAGMEPIQLLTVCDIKSYRSAVNSWGFGLTFALQEIEVDDLGRFAKRTGRCEVQVLGNSGEEDKASDRGTREEVPEPQRGGKKPPKAPKPSAPAAPATPAPAPPAANPETAAPKRRGRPKKAV